MAKLTGRTAALPRCSLIFAFAAACGSGSDPEPTQSTASASVADASGRLRSSQIAVATGAIRLAESGPEVSYPAGGSVPQFRHLSQPPNYRSGRMASP